MEGDGLSSLAPLDHDSQVLSLVFMGCRLRVCPITLSQLSIYGVGKAFSLNKSKGGGVGAQLWLAWSS